MPDCRDFAKFGYPTVAMPVPVRIDLTDWRERVKEIRGLADNMRNPRAIEIVRRIAADDEKRARNTERSRRGAKRDDDNAEQ